MSATPSTTFILGLPWVLPVGAVATLLLVARSAYLLRQRRVAKGRVAALSLLRLLGLGLLVVLVARPTAVLDRDATSRRTVTLLLDHSSSMALADGSDSAGLDGGAGSRYGRALSWARDTLEPAFRSRGFKIEVSLFHGRLEKVGSGSQLEAEPKGSHTDLAGAVAEAVQGSSPPPAAVIALSDGVANVHDANRTAVAALVGSGTPFVGIAIGEDEEVDRLSLESLQAPTQVPPHQELRLAARLQATTTSELPSFELLLTRDGLLVESRRVGALRGSRIWTELFRRVEEEEGVHHYAVEIVAPPAIRLARQRASATVRISDEEELRVLFAQGALAWNYKFARRALVGDPGLRLTGLSRTSEKSVFRQNVETAGELLDGFPSTLDALSPFRVVVLSELRPADLSPEQQEALVRFVSELGGGVLMIGGEATFDATWAESRLEDLLPVTFDATGAVAGLDRPFHIELEPAAQRHPIFQLAGSGDGQTNAQLWQDLPTFDLYGKIRGAKAGATVWAKHDSDIGPNGARILMAGQTYGAGRTAVLAVQNLWRWRLSRDSQPAHFDRFWRQLLRWLGQSAGQKVVIQPGGGGRIPGSEVEMLVERRALPEDGEGVDGSPGASRGSGNGSGGKLDVTVKVTDPSGQEIHRQSSELRLSSPISVRFRAETAGLYSVRVVDAADNTLGTRPIEIQPVEVELLRTSRDLDNLRQWAAVSQGLAMPFEECTDADALVEEVLSRVEALRRQRQLHLPLGLDPRVLAILLGAFFAEWALRKQWGLA